MTVIRPNSVSGITSITAQANEINFFRSNGALAGLQLNGVNFNTTTGVSTFNNLDVGGVLTYQDVTNVDSVGIITARSTIDAQGAINLADSIIHTGDTNTKIRFPAADTITAETGGSERLRINSDGRLLIGSSSVVNLGGSSANSQLQIEGTSGNTSSLSLIRNQNNTGGSIIRFGKTRGSSTGAVTTVADGDILGSLTFSGADGTDLQNATAQIKALVNGTVGGNQIPTDITFETSATSGNARAERLRITSTGAVKITGADDQDNFIVDAAQTQFKIHQDTTDGEVSLRAEDGSGNNYLKYMTFFVEGGSGPTERLRIASNGDIGLGTVPETDSFQPSLYFAGGNANIWGSGNANLYTAVNVRYTGAGGWKYNNNGLGSYTAQQSGTWEFRNAPSGTADNVATFTTRVRIDSSGRVMIGTTTEGNGNADEFTISYINHAGVSGGDQGRCGMTIRSGDNTSGVTQNGYIYFSDGTSGANESMGVVAYEHSTDSMYFSTAQVARLRIDSSGNLGLGVAAVPQDSGAKTLHIHDSDTGNSARAAIRLTHGSIGSSAGNGAFIGMDNNPDFYLYNMENGKIRFGTNDALRMMISQSGGVIFGGGINEGVTEPFFVETGGTIRRRYQTVNGSGIHFTGGALMPTTGPGAFTNGGTNIGTGSHRWGQIYSSSSSISTSDRTLKNNIQSSDLGLEFIKKLNPVSYKFNDGTSGRTHYGLISQDVETVLTSLGKTGVDFGGFCKDKNTRVETIPDENGEMIDVKIEEEGDTYSLRYEEFIGPLIKAIQDLADENVALRARVTKLEGN